MNDASLTTHVCEPSDDQSQIAVRVNVSSDSRQYMVETCLCSCYQCRLGIGGFGKFGEFSEYRVRLKLGDSVVEWLGRLTTRGRGFASRS